MSRLESFLSLTMLQQASMVNRLLIEQSFSSRNRVITGTWKLFFEMEWQYAVKVSSNRENDAAECISRNSSLFSDQ